MNAHAQLVRAASRDYRAFLAKIAGGLKYETKDDGDEVKQLVTEIKTSIGEGIDGLRKEIKTVADRQDKLETAFKRAPGGNADPGEAQKALEVKALNEWFHRGGNTRLDEFVNNHAEYKTLLVQSDPDGGYFVSPTMADAIYTLQKTIDPIRQLARVVTITTDSWEELLSRGTLNSGWTNETGTRGTSATPQVEKFRVPVHEHFAQPVASQKIIEDSAFSVEQWLDRELADGFALAESSAFLEGNGVGQPRGFLDYPKGTAADATRGWGTLQTVPTGVAAAFGTSAAAGLAYTDPFDQVIGQMKPQYLSGARWLMSSTTKAEIAKLKDTTGRSLVFDNLQSGQPASIRGYPITLVEGMDSVGTDAYPVAFANLQEGYQIVDRLGISTLRDPYTAKPHVLFYSRKRVGGDVRNSEAIKFIKTGTGA